MAVSLAQICDGVKTTLSTATGITTVLSYDELHEGPSEADLPLIQIYPDIGICDPSGDTDATTFGALVRQHDFVFLLDLMVTQRGHIEEDMEACVNAIDNVMDALETENSSPRFGLSGVKAFSWRWERMMYRYASGDYLGARFWLSVRVY